MKYIEIIVIHLLYITNPKNNRQKMFEGTETEAMQRTNQGIKGRFLEPKVLTFKGFFPGKIALFIFSMIVYKTDVHFFRLFVFQEKTQKHYHNLRYEKRTFAIGAYFEKVG